MTTFNIYGLHDPRSNALRYIGRTQWALARRLTKHLTAARRDGTSPVERWVRSLLDQTLEPVITLIEQTDDPDREVFWIAQHRTAGTDLLNLQPGGGGVFAGVAVSEETRAKLAAAQTGKSYSDAARAKMRAAKLGTHPSADTRAKMSATHRARTESIPIDPAATYLGALCKRGHDHQNTGRTLRHRGDRSCIQCKRAHGRVPTPTLEGSS